MLASSICREEFPRQSMCMFSEALMRMRKAASTICILLIFERTDIHWKSSSRTKNCLAYMSYRATAACMLSRFLGVQETLGN